jgi:hypothetical protein
MSFAPNAVHPQYNPLEYLHCHRHVENGSPAVALFLRAVCAMKTTLRTKAQ